MMAEEASKNKKTDLRLALILAGAMLAGWVAVNAAGWRFAEDLGKMGLKSLLAMVNSSLSVATMCLIIVGCSLGSVRNFKKGAAGYGLAHAAAILFAALWAGHELVLVHRTGFLPETLARTGALFLGFMVAYAFLLAPRDAPAADEKPEPRYSGWLVLLLVVGLGAFAVWQSDMARDLSPSASAQASASGSRRHPVPARHEELAKAFVCLCAKDNSAPGGCGVFVGMNENGKRTVHLMTAAHVAAQCIESGLTNDVSLIAYHGEGKSDVAVTLRESVPWGQMSRYADIVMTDVTPYFEGLVKNGWDVKYIPAFSLPCETADTRAVAGGFMLPSKLFPNYRIGIGTTVIAYGNAFELWNFPSARKFQPLSLRSGIISSRLDLLADLTPGTPPPFVVELEAYPGYSGGPVFANVQVGPYFYPAFVGLTSGFIQTSAGASDERLKRPKNSGLSLITPLDEFLRTKADLAALEKPAKKRNPAR